MPCTPCTPCLAVNVWGPPVEFLATLARDATPNNPPPPCLAQALHAQTCLAHVCIARTGACHTAVTMHAWALPVEHLVLSTAHAAHTVPVAMHSTAHTPAAHRSNSSSSAHALHAQTCHRALHTVPSAYRSNSSSSAGSGALCSSVSPRSSSAFCASVRTISWAAMATWRVNWRSLDWERARRM